MASKVLDSALDRYLESGALHAIMPFRAELDALAAPPLPLDKTDTTDTTDKAERRAPPTLSGRRDGLRRIAGAELSLWLLDTRQAAAHLDVVATLSDRSVSPIAARATNQLGDEPWILGALYSCAAQLQYRNHANYEKGIVLCDLADRHLARESEISWLWSQKNRVTRARLLYRSAPREQASRLLDETDQAVRSRFGLRGGASAQAIEVVLGITNEIRAAIAATNGDLNRAHVLIMESLVSLAERDPVRHAYAYLTASRIYSAIGGENMRLATRYAALAVEEFAEYGHAFEARSRNQLTRCHLKLQDLREAEAERSKAIHAIERIRNADEKTFAIADQRLSEARLEQARSHAAKTQSAALAHWKKAETAARAALEREPVPKRIRAEALVRTGQAILQQRPKSAKAMRLVVDGIDLAASLKRVRLVAAGHLVLAEHFHAQRQPLKALMHLELAQQIEQASSSEVIEQWMNRLTGSIDQPVRVEVRGRQYREVVNDFQERLKDYYVGISRGDEAVFRKRSGLGRSEFFRAK